MGIVEYTITLGSGATRATTDRKFLMYLRVENEDGNDPVYVGGENVDATSYGFSVIAEDETNQRSNAVVVGPFPAAHIPLHDLYLYGTQNQKVHLFGIEL